jgi:LmbE family N-acetylglucosaminyl deacetylase
MRSEPDLNEGAWIIAPHQDDEVLGCGGTILLKRRFGADICVVFLTDGSSSHGDAVNRARLVELRKAEALNACRAMDVDSGRVFFLGLTDGRLMENVDRCAAELRKLFARFPANQFFVPHRLEPPSDHKAARLATLKALEGSGTSVRVFEYAVWCWDLWPLVGIERGGSWPRRIARRAKRLLSTAYWISGCRAFVDVRDVAAAKRCAFLEHKSQAVGLPEVPDAPTLFTLRNGEFAERLIGPYEVFAFSDVRGEGREASPSKVSR